MKGPSVEWTLGLRGRTHQVQDGPVAEIRDKDRIRKARGLLLGAGRPDRWDATGQGRLSGRPIAPGPSAHPWRWAQPD